MCYLLCNSVSKGSNHYLLFFFFFNDTATTEIYTLSLHDALPISRDHPSYTRAFCWRSSGRAGRSEEHTSELQSLAYLVCRLLLEKKKKNIHTTYYPEKKQHSHIEPRKYAYA